MEYRILGRLEVLDEGRPLPLGGWQQRALLAILLLERNHPVSLDRLVDELWGEQPPKAAIRTVRVYISRLRQVLGEQTLQTRDRGYLLHLEAGAVDAERYEQLVAEARRLAGEEDAAGARELLEQAARLWRSPPLGEFGGAPFAQAEIARLEELHLSAREEQLDLALADGEAASLTPELEALCACHPLRERLAAQLMTALYRSGRQADALAVYRRTRDALDEVGIEPSESLSRLYTRMLQHDPSLSPRELSVVPRPVAAAIRGRRRLWIGTAVVVGLALLIGALFLRPGEAKPTPRSSQIELVIGAPPPNDQGTGASSSPTLETSLASGAETLRRHGTPVQIAFAPGFSAVTDHKAIESAARHAGLVVDYPALPETLNLIASVARRYPQTRIVLIDHSVHELPSLPSNVTGMPFDNRELGYLAGYLSALQGGHPPVVSAVAGVDIPPVEQILSGFQAGAHHADPSTRVITRYSGTFLTQPPCATQANREIDAGSKVVFDVAGSCGLGALTAAGLRGVWGVGIDTDLSNLSPSILASAVKRFDNAVELAVQLYLQGKLPRGRDVPLNLGNEGVGLVGLSSHVSAGTRSRLARVATEMQRHDSTPSAGGVS